MSKVLTRWAIGCGVLSAVSSAVAQDATGGVSLSTETGADASGAASAPEPVAAAPASSAEPVSNDPYEDGYPPENNLFELGVFGGVMFPSKDHNLRDERLPHRDFKAGPEIGARLGYYPLSFLGFEGEAMGSLNQVKGEGEGRGGLYSVRGHLVLQAPLPYFVPFAVGGFGRLGAISDTMGKDSDRAWHFGIGAKIPLTHALSLRLDGRDNLVAKHLGSDSAQSHNFEATLGLTAVLGRTRREPPPPADSDRDGVIDSQDQCPTEHGIAPKGCPADSDGDSVLDRDDYCPKEAGPAPKGCPVIDPDPDKDGVPLPCDVCPEEVGVKPDGCPIRDKDGDGIFDDKDKCINEPETKNGFEDADGCPDKLPEAIKKFTGVIEGIYFEQGKATIRAQSTPKLDGATKVLKEFPSISMEITGHTSSEGDKDFNQKLSEDRAAAVKEWLVNKGIPSERIRTRGAGPDEPIADNKTAAGRAKNRRIEFKVIQ